MTTIESRIAQKRVEAFKALEEFKKWHLDTSRPNGQLLYVALTRDILQGTEDEIEYLIESLTDRNLRAFERKLRQGL